MGKTLDRRHFMQLAGLAGVVFASGLSGWPKPAQAAGASAKLDASDFFFVQMSDSHWGFEGAANPDAHGTLQKAVAAVNQLTRQPDFIVFTGDLTHTTDDPRERRRRMTEFKSIIADLKVQRRYLMPGEHDAALDNGKAYRELFGETHYTFDHQGVHFIVLDNVSDPGARLGDPQLAWLADDLARQPQDAPIVVFTHRPLFDLYPQWDWATTDGARAIDLLLAKSHVTVFYGHIHQENHQMTGHIAHHAAKSLIFPLPGPGSQAKRTPLPWDSTQPYRGLGVRQIAAGMAPLRYDILEVPVVGEAA